MPSLLEWLQLSTTRPSRSRSIWMPETLVANQAGRGPRADRLGCVFARAPEAVDELELAFEVLVARWRERVIIGWPPAGTGAEQREGDRPGRIGRREQRRHRAALGHPEDDGALRSDRIHHGARVVHTHLE